MKTFLRAMGSELEKPVVREAARHFDLVHTGPYGFRMVEEFDLGLRPKIIVWVNPFAHSRYEAKKDDWLPTPEAVGHAFMPLQWGEVGQTACAYDWTDGNWPGEFIKAVMKFKRLNPWTRILVDDWRCEHPWWRGMQRAHYQKTIATEQQLRKVANEIISPYDLVNGPFTSQAYRFWEMWGRDDYHTLEIFKNAKPNEHIYCATAKWRNEIMAKAVGAARGCYVGIGLPDGESLTDENGDLKIWVPK